MHHIRKIFINCLLLLLIFNTFLFSQDVELITQKINVENAIRDKVNVTINKLLQQSQYVIIVNARMDVKPFSLSGDADGNKKSNSTYSAIPGLLPSVPQNIKQNTGGTYQYASDKYLLYGLDIAVYLESSVATGVMRKNIEALIKESISEIQDCDDCIRFETMNMSENGSNNSYDDLLAKIEKLEADKRSAEQQILNWKFDELEKQLALSEDARTEWEQQARQREKSRQTSDSLRLVNLESIEKEYRKKQDSLYLVTSLKLDEALRGRLESSDQITDKLMDIIKSGMDPGADKDLLDRPKDSGISSTVLVLIIVGVFCILTLAGVIMLTRSGSKKTVYLKPKESNSSENTADMNASSIAANLQNTQAPSFNPTQAHDNSDVVRSDLKDLRQSAVALGVSQKDGSNQIVQDWLDTGGDSESNNNDATDSDIEE